MAITAPTVTGDFAGFLSPTMSAPIFESVRQTSVVQKLARRIQLGISGVEIPYVTTKPVAGWVAEGGTKPATAGGMALKTMTPKKLAAIAVVSAEVVRANPGNYMSIYRQDVVEAFALAFDSATLHGTSTPFTTYIDQTTKTVELGTAAAAAGGIHSDVNSGLSQLVLDGKKLTGFAFDTVAEPLFNAAVDTTGRPLFIDSPLVQNATTVREGRILGRPAFIGDGVKTSNTGTIGYGGDWSEAAWGAVGGISFDVSTEATVTINGVLTSLWEKNLVAIRAEAEYGWLVNDVAAFVEYTNAA